MQSRAVMTIHGANWMEAPEEEAEEAQKQLAHAMKYAVDMPFVPSEGEFE